MPPTKTVAAPETSAATHKFGADNNPLTPGTVVARQRPALRIVRDVFGGTLRLQEEHATYLPKWPKEDDDSYAARVKAAVLFNAFAKSVAGMTGMVYRDPPTLSEDLPETIARDLADVDLQGHDLAEFGQMHFLDAMTDGHAAIFVDQQRYPEGRAPKSRADELRLGLRPYWVTIRKGDLLRPRVARIDGRMMLTQIAWRERTVEAKGQFGDTEVERVRELALEDGTGPDGRGRRYVSWRLWQRVKPHDDTSWFVADEGVMRTMPEIPVAVTYTGYMGELESVPPLLDLAIENLRHFRKTSDQDNIEHVACVPIFGIFGVDDDQLGPVGVGPAIGMRFSSPDARAEWAEITGASIGELRESVRDIERRMAVQGLSMLMPEAQAPQTATWKRIEKAESDSALSLAARSHQGALNRALYFHGLWRGVDLDPTTEWVSLRRDFGDLVMSPDVMRAYVHAVDRAGLPPRVLLEAWQQYGRIPEDADVDALEMEMHVGKAMQRGPEGADVDADG